MCDIPKRKCSKALQSSVYSLAVCGERDIFQKRHISIATYSNTRPKCNRRQERMSRRIARFITMLGLDYAHTSLAGASQILLSTISEQNSVEACRPYSLPDGSTSPENYLNACPVFAFIELQGVATELGATNSPKTRKVMSGNYWGAVEAQCH